MNKIVLLVLFTLENTAVLCIHNAAENIQAFTVHQIPPLQITCF